MTTNTRIEAAAIALYVAIAPKARMAAGYEGIGGTWRKHYRDSARAALAAADKAATITDPAQLTESPSGTAVIDGEGIIVGRDTSGTWMEFGTEERFHSRDIALPARVLHWGTE